MSYEPEMTPARELFERWLVAQDISPDDVWDHLPDPERLAWERVAAPQVQLDEDELEVMTLLTTAYNRILGWGLQANVNELVMGLHIVQSFVIQHMLNRMAPGKFGTWYEARPEEKELPSG